MSQVFNKKGVRYHVRKTIWMRVWRIRLCWASDFPNIWLWERVCFNCCAIHPAHYRWRGHLL